MPQLQTQTRVEVEAHYCAPPGWRLADVLRLLRTRTWAAFMARHISPRLEKLSPVDAAVLAALDRRWEARARARATATATATTETGERCVICMSDAGEARDAELPCGHGFHRACIRPWLETRSSCPICRCQLPRAFAGSFAVRSLVSTVLLPPEMAAWPRAQVAQADVGDRLVRVGVCVTLEKDQGVTQQQPCVVAARVQDGEGVVEAPSHALEVELAQEELQAAKCRGEGNKRRRAVAAGDSGAKRRRAGL